MFHKLHSSPRDWSQNTTLALTTTSQGYQNVPRLKINTIVFRSDSKHLHSLIQKINPSQTPRLVENLSELSDHLKSVVKLFEKVNPPDCLQFYVEGWVTSHEKVSLDGGDERTVLGIKDASTTCCCAALNIQHFRFVVLYRSDLLHHQVLPQQQGNLPEETPPSTSARLSEGPEGDTRHGQSEAEAPSD